MEREKAEKIIWMIDWLRFIILALLLTLIFVGLGRHNQNNDATNVHLLEALSPIKYHLYAFFDTTNTEISFGGIFVGKFGGI